MRRAGPRRARALSQYHTWGGAGSVVFPLTVAGLLAAGVPWHSAFVLIVVAYLVHAWVTGTCASCAPRPPTATRGRWWGRAPAGRSSSPSSPAACSSPSRSLLLARRGPLRRQRGDGERGHRRVRARRADRAGRRHRADAEAAGRSAAARGLRRDAGRLRGAGPRREHPRPVVAAFLLGLGIGQLLRWDRPQRARDRRRPLHDGPGLHVELGHAAGQPGPRGAAAAGAGPACRARGDRAAGAADRGRRVAQPARGPSPGGRAMHDPRIALHPRRRHRHRGHPRGPAALDAVGRRHAHHVPLHELRLVLRRATCATAR